MDDEQQARAAELTTELLSVIGEWTLGHRHDDGDVVITAVTAAFVEIFAKYIVVTDTPNERVDLMLVDIAESLRVRIEARRQTQRP